MNNTRGPAPMKHGTPRPRGPAPRGVADPRRKRGAPPTVTSVRAQKCPNHLPVYAGTAWTLVHAITAPSGARARHKLSDRAPRRCRRLKRLLRSVKFIYEAAERLTLAKGVARCRHQRNAPKSRGHLGRARVADPPRALDFEPRRSMQRAWLRARTPKSCASTARSRWFIASHAGAAPPFLPGNPGSPPCPGTASLPSTKTPHAAKRPFPPRMGFHSRDAPSDARAASPLRLPNARHGNRGPTGPLPGHGK